MNLRQICFALTLGVAAFRADGALLINEVLYNEVGSDVNGEWIEIYNNGLTAIDLTNFKIGDEEQSGAASLTEGMFMFPAGASIGPGEIQIIAIGATRFQTVYGFLPTYELAGTHPGVPDLAVYSAWDPDTDPTNKINMSNSNDQLAILDSLDAIVDGVNWGNTQYFDPGLAPTVADGQSYQRNNPFTDTNTAADWSLGSPSSPGAIPEPGSLALGVAGALFLGMARGRRR